jgi:Uroporphyrinogen decarboxylase (URO-D)
MNSRQRFHETMSYGAPDRVPLFQEGIREDVLDAWHQQGLPPGMDLAALFHYDELEEIEPILDPLPAIPRQTSKKSIIEKLRRRLDPCDPRRLPSDWHEQVRRWQGSRQATLFLRVHRGFFLTMGVEGWHSFTEAIWLLKDDPAFVHEVMAVQAGFVASLAEHILREIEVDGVIFHEPIASTHGPLISPKMYEDFVLKSYEPILDVVERFNVKTIILRTYANARALLPVVFKSRINTLWACECNSNAMDYRLLRAEFGPGIRLIGGIDADVLRQNHEAIRQEVDDKVTPLLAQGGFVPLADGRVREGVPFENYAFYRRYLEELAQG